MIYDVDIKTLELSRVLSIQGSAPDVASLFAGLDVSPPQQPNTVAQGQGLSIYWVGPTQWIVRTQQSPEERLLPELQPAHRGGNISVVDISDTLQFFSVGGRDADNVMSICCPLDIHDMVFPANGVTFTAIFGTKALLLRMPEGYEFAVDRSYADFANDSLHRILGSALPVNHAGRSSQ